jgi:hypothetical protein
MFTDNISIYLDFLTLLDIQVALKSFYSPVITLTEENKVSKQFVYYWHIKSSTLRISSCSEEITNVSLSIECMVFMMSAKEGTIPKSGKNSVIVLMYYQLVQLLMIEFSACMVV